LEVVNRLAKTDELPDATITGTGLKITPLTNAVPNDTYTLMQQAYNLLLHVKITELLMEVDEWTNFTRHFTHIKSGNSAADKILLLKAILADAINLGFAKMAESCPDTTYAKLSWLQAWHIRDETYVAALAELVNAHFRHPFAENWGDGTTSSSDPRQNGLVVALRELGRIERSLFTLDWLQNVEIRRRVHAGLNKGEARNALARAVFFNRLGEMRDRSFENQLYRASGLNL
jgi:hypothetical protein